MPLDRTTEAIAHFIGLFHLDAEAARLRDSYDAFRAAQDELPPPGDLPGITISLRAPYEVDRFDPDLKGLPLAARLPQAAAGPAPEAPARAAPPAPSPRWEAPPAAEPAVVRPGPGTPVPHWDVPLPNSILTVTIQSHWMSDDDILDFGLGHAFVAPAAFTAELLDLAETAESLAPDLSALVTPGQVPGVAAMQAVLAAAGTPDMAAIEGARVLQGAEASGIVVNGAQAEEMPVFGDNLPVAQRDEEETAEEDAAGDEAAHDPPPPAFPGQEADEAPDPYAVEPGHHVMAGGNLVVNETHVGSAWVDAPVIAVMNDVTRVDLISQVAVLRDHDSGSHSGAPSAAMNAAQIELRSSAPGDAADVAPAAGPFPEHWEVVRVAGDVVSLDWIEQHIFATDHDRAEIVFSGSNTHVGLGANTLYNLASLTAMGFHYDLIVVGGSMVSMNLIQQVNVLLDSDIVTGTLTVPDLISGGDNYLQNSAIISTTGIDTAMAMTEAFRAAGEAFAAGAETITAGLAADPLFAGLTTLSVLYIEGDLIELNAISQFIYMGDADQVHLALEEFVGGADGVSVTTGSNALLNAARINDVGLDSTILAGGEVYSAALIHQAELIETDAMPGGVAMAALTGEAIAAFLASDMIDPPAAADEAGAPPAIGDGGSLDVMQSYLA